MATPYKTTVPFPFTGPAKGARRENRAAHGGISFMQERSDGARREVNVNGNHREFGSWR